MHPLTLSTISVYFDANGSDTRAWAVQALLENKTGRMSPPSGSVNRFRRHGTEDMTPYVLRDQNCPDRDADCADQRLITDGGTVDPDDFAVPSVEEIEVARHHTTHYSRSALAREAGLDESTFTGAVTRDADIRLSTLADLVAAVGADWTLPTPEDLQAMRLDLGLTIPQLAEAAEMHEQTAHATLKSTRDPMASTVRQLLRALQDAEPEHDPQTLAQRLEHADKDLVTDGGQPVAEDGREIYCCPNEECESARFNIRTTAENNGPRYFCRDCRLRFDEPAQRRTQHHGSRVGMAKTLVESDPDDLVTDGGRDQAWRLRFDVGAVEHTSQWYPDYATIENLAEQFRRDPSFTDIEIESRADVEADADRELIADD